MTGLGFATDIPFLTLTFPYEQIIALNSLAGLCWRRLARVRAREDDHKQLSGEKIHNKTLVSPVVQSLVSYSGKDDSNNQLLQMIQDGFAGRNRWLGMTIGCLSSLGT